MSCYSYPNSYGENFDWRNVKVPEVTGTSMSRAVEVAKYLNQNGGFTKEQAAACAGVYIDENDCNPTKVNTAERDGKGAKGTSGFGYGAGIASWTETNFKNTALTQAGFKEYTPIETLSLQDQCKMIIGNANGNMKKYYNALKRCANIEDASATAVCITGGTGYARKGVWSGNNHPTSTDGKMVSDVYCKSNNKRFGYSEYHCNLYGRRLQYARQVLKEMG